MNELFGTGLAWMLSVAVYQACVRWRRDSPEDMRLLRISFVAHMLSSLAMIFVLVEIYGGGDMIFYHIMGSRLTQLRDYDEVTTSGLLQTFLQMKGGSAVGYSGATGSMIAATALVQTVVGPFLYAATIVFATGAFLGKFLIYETFRPLVPQEHTTRLALGTMLVPSGVFWTSSILKESLALLGLGLLAWGAVALWRRRTLPHLLVAVTGFVLIGLVKPYLIFPFGVAGAVWFYWRRPSDHDRKQTSLLRLGVGVAFCCLAAAVVGEFSPRYTVSNISERTSFLQEVGVRTAGGSNFQIVDPSARGLVEQFAFAPIALFTAMFRPFPWEAHNLMAMINVLESATLSAVFLAVLWRNGPRGTLTRVLSSPELMAFAAFTLVCGVGIGLTTTNMGTLSRYRVPMLPFYVSLLLILHAWPESASPVEAEPTTSEVAQHSHAPWRQDRPPPITSAR